MNWVALMPLLLATTASVTGLSSPVAHTFSIVARDSVTGELGVAVQSHYFSVGPVVPWAEAGVGAVATQSLVLVDYGPGGLDLMRGGRSAQEALDSLLKADAHNDGRDAGGCTSLTAQTADIEVLASALQCAVAGGFA